MQRNRDVPAESGQPDETPTHERIAAGERLQKYLARSGVASRRHAEELIAKGAVSLNGQVVREMGARVHPSDEVRVHGNVVLPAQEHLYILLNKPANAVTTARDTHGRRTVMDLLPPAWRAARVFPVGRLDRDTEGLLLLTTDGDLALRLTHPRYALPKEYRALVLGHPTGEEIARLERGVFLEGEVRPTAPARVWVEQPVDGNTWMGVELHEGRKRQVRGMFDVIAHPVLRLERVRLGPLTLGDLPRGSTRLLSPAEVEALRQAAIPSGGKPHRGTAR
ncbi:MAG TPA: pseudouridine synthase [Ktedonobacterales bacterium]